MTTPDPLERPRTLTNPSLGDWRDAIVRAWPEATPEGLSVMWAQWALETGRGKACFNHNLGNRKAKTDRRTGRPTEPWMWLQTWEILSGKRVDMRDRFAAFDTLTEGARDYVAFMRRPSYARAWAQLERGDAASFSRELKRLRYYTADEGEYTRGLRSLAAEYLRKVPPPAQSSPSVATPDADTPRVGSWRPGDLPPALQVEPAEWQPRRITLEELGIMSGVLSEDDTADNIG